VPQRAVTRTQTGQGSVMVVDDTNHAQIKLIDTDDSFGDKWIVSSGLNAGEKVIIEGLLKARPGAQVVPEPFLPATPKATGQAPAKDGKKG